jgi:hypothetical protein
MSSGSNSSNSSSNNSSCQTTPRSNKDSNSFRITNVMSKIKKLEHVAAAQAASSSKNMNPNLILNRKMAKISTDEIQNCDNNSKTKPSNSTSSSSSTSSFDDINNTKKSIYTYKSQSALIKLQQLQQNQIMQSPSSSMTAATILTNNTNKYSQSPKFLQLFQNQMKYDDNNEIIKEREDEVIKLNQKNYRKLEDIMNEADSILSNNAQKYNETIIDNKTYTISSSSSSSSSASPVTNEVAKAKLRKQQPDSSSSPSSTSSTSPTEIFNSIPVDIAKETTRSFLKSTKKYDSAYELQNTNNEPLIYRLNTINDNSNSSANIKVDATPCILPSNLKQQRSQSLAGPKILQNNSQDVDRNDFKSTPMKKSNSSNITNSSGFVKNASLLFSSTGPNVNVNNGLAKRYLY